MDLQVNVAAHSFVFFGKICSFNGDYIITFLAFAGLFNFGDWLELTLHDACG